MYKSILLILAGSTSLALADQPIMNMMPRWDGGWGFQFIEEYRHYDSYLDGTSKVRSDLDLEEEMHILHFQGVYTWDRSVRFTFKLPYVLDATRTIPHSSGTGVEKQRTSGFDDLQLALPLKKYFNEEGYSGSWTLAPQLIVPTGRTSGDYTLGDNSWGYGLSLGYEVETTKWFFAASVTGFYNDGAEPEEVYASVDLGWNFNDQGQLLWETDFHGEDDGTRTVSTGPALYYRLSDTVHMRAAWKHDFYDKQGTLDHGDGDSFRLGIGFVF